MKQRNRGKQSNDDKLFGPKWLPILYEAVNDMCYLLSRGYAGNSALQIVGNQYKLNKRQRTAIWRISSSDQEVSTRTKSLVDIKDLAGQNIDLDGFNLLILLESALSGAYIFKCRDSTYRDISGVHGSYKRVRVTREAIVLVGITLQKLKVDQVKWYLDKPVSNSGKLKTMLMDLSNSHQFNWQVELKFNPDNILARSRNIVVTTDGWILDRVIKWFNLGAYMADQINEELNIIEV